MCSRTALLRRLAPFPAELAAPVVQAVWERSRLAPVLALIGVLYAGGLRRVEAAGLALADYDRATGALAVRHGKGNKQRLVYLPEGVRRALADWLAVRGEAPGPLFGPINKGGKLADRALSAQAVYSALHKRVAQAGVPTCRPTTCGAPSSAICSMPGRTSAPSSGWPATPR